MLKKFVCYNCGKNFSRKDHYNVHKLRINKCIPSNKEIVKNSENFTKYVGKCHSMIGILKGLCTSDLIQLVKSDPSYIIAHKKGDIVRLGHIIKTCVMNTDSANISDERARRSMALQNFIYEPSKMNFSQYTDRISTMYEEYKECCDKYDKRRRLLSLNN